MAVTTETQFRDDSGEVRLEGTIGAPGATATNVLTADGAGGTSWSPAGGGSIPDPITTAVVINPATDVTPLLVENTPSGTALLAIFQTQRLSGGEVSIDSHGSVTVEAGTDSVFAAIGCANDNAAQNAFEAWDTGYNNLAVAVTGTGYLKVAKNAAPADGDLADGECAVWFDATNGASKFMFKGKSADGTVVTAAVTLA